jgi:hypothetical protein
LIPPEIDATIIWNRARLFTMELQCTPSLPIIIPNIDLTTPCRPFNFCCSRCLSPGRGEQQTACEQACKEFGAQLDSAASLTILFLLSMLRPSRARCEITSGEVLRRQRLSATKEEEKAERRGMERKGEKSLRTGSDQEACTSHVISRLDQTGLSARVNREHPLTRTGTAHVAY